MKYFIYIVESDGSPHLINTRFIIDVSINSKNLTMLTVLVKEVEPNYIKYYVVDESIVSIQNLIRSSQE